MRQRMASMCRTSDRPAQPQIKENRIYPKVLDTHRRKQAEKRKGADTGRCEDFHELHASGGDAQDGAAEVPQQLQHAGAHDNNANEGVDEVDLLGQPRRAPLLVDGVRGGLVRLPPI